MATRKPIVFHPAVLAICPVLYLYSRNAGEVLVTDILPPAVVLLAGTILVLMIWRLLVKDWAKAGLLTSLLVLMAFAYAPVFWTVHAVCPPIHGFVIVRHRLVLALWGILCIGLSMTLIRTRRDLKTVTSFANVLALMLVCISAITLVGNDWRAARAPHVRGAWADKVARYDNNKLVPRKPIRDIYLIILDDYSGADVLKKWFGYDNTAFLDHLRSKGFYVPAHAHSQRCTTYRSLASTLNLESVDTILGKNVADAASPQVFERMIEDNRVCRLLKRAGYQIIFMPAGVGIVRSIRLADHTFMPGGIELSDFDKALIMNSFLCAFRASTTARRRRVLYQLDRLAEIPRINQPTFTFAHIPCPHDPYVFDKDGGYPQDSADSIHRTDPSPEERETSKRLYIAQLQYLNKRIAHLVDTIIAESDVPPIIIIEADHGMYVDATSKLRPGWGNDVRRTKNILSAFHFPDSDSRGLTESMRSINTFRALFNDYFGTDYRLLQDTTGQEDKDPK